MSYAYFDDIVCITLNSSLERQKHAEFFFKKLNIPCRFFIAHKHPNGGMYGCFDSHIQVLKNAYKKGLNNILVLEDDFLPTDSYSEDRLNKAIQFMKTNKDWDIFHLGYSFIKDDIYTGITTVFNGKYITDDIVQYNPFCTQALCYSKRAIKQIVENYNDYIGLVHYDMFIATHLKLKNYCIVPMLFDQNFYFEHNNSSTDGIEAFIRMIMPLFTFTKLNYRITLLKYWYQKYKNTKRFLHMLILSLIIYKIKGAVVSSKKLYINDIGFNGTNRC